MVHREDRFIAAAASLWAALDPVGHKRALKQLRTVVQSVDSQQLADNIESIASQSNELSSAPRITPPTDTSAAHHVPDLEPKRPSPEPQLVTFTEEDDDKLYEEGGSATVRLKVTSSQLDLTPTSPNLPKDNSHLDFTPLNEPNTSNDVPLDPPPTLQQKDSILEGIDDRPTSWPDSPANRVIQFESPQSTIDIRKSFGEYSPLQSPEETRNSSPPSIRIKEVVRTLSISEDFDVSKIPGLDDLSGLVEQRAYGGSGGFGDVHRGVLKSSPQQSVAIKVLKQQYAHDEHPERIKRHLCREVAVMHGLDHSNIVKVLGISRDFGPLPAIISPWYPNGNALQFLKSHPDADRMRIIRGVASGLVYMHSRSPAVVHGDLKPQNILIAENGDATLCDFGVAKVAREAELSSGFTTTAVLGTLCFMAAELHVYDEMPVWTTASDVYAFGGTCSQLVIGTAPSFERKNLILAISLGEKPKRPKNFSHDGLWELLLRCWELQPEYRPDMGEIANLLTEITL